jgi:hypothetical protein
MIELLVGLILLCILLYAVYTVLGMLTLPPSITTLIYLLIAVIVLLWVLDRFGLYSFR